MNMSIKKLEANRRNALKSTGPRTVEGKRRSSRNALKHGIFSSKIPDPMIDTEEDIVCYHMLRLKLLHDVAEGDEVGRMLAERLAINHLRKNRLLRHETELLKLIHEENEITDLSPDGDDEDMIVNSLPRAHITGLPILLLDRYERRLDNEFFRLLKQYELRRKG